MFKRFSLVMACASLILISGCLGSDDGLLNRNVRSASVEDRGANETRSMVSFNQALSSNKDGSRIAITIHEPKNVVKGESYPLVLHSHGYGGRRQIARPTEGLIALLLANGYGVLSIDERGHGALTDGSGGAARVLDPEFEGRDLLQILDWAEQNLDWLQFRDGNPVMGAIGGSYGGGYQNLIYRIDPKKRLDAMSPHITWHDLRYSLFPGNVFKTFWTTLVGVAGNSPGNIIDPLVNLSMLNGAATNTFNDEFKQLLYNNSIASNCEGARPQDPELTPIAALFIQSPIDQLFNLNEAYKNFECLRKLGGDVRLFVIPNGHVGGPHSRCGSMEMDDAILLFFHEHLKQLKNASSTVPKICFHLDNVDATSTDSVSVDEVTIGGTAVAEVGVSGLTLSTLSNTATHLPLLTFNNINDPEGDGDIVAGIPTIELTLNNPNPSFELFEPILFIGLSRSVDSGKSWTLIHDQVMPFRGYGQFSTELVGVLERFQPNDMLGLAVFDGRVDQFGTSGSRPAAFVDLAAKVKVPLIGANKRS
jgi:ABC-2 type transport system ATP-binding protein